MINDPAFYKNLSKKFREKNSIVDMEKLISLINEDKEMFKVNLDKLEVNQLYKAFYSYRFMLSEPSKQHISNLFMELTDSYEKLSARQEVEDLRNTMKKSNIFNE